MDGWKFVRIPKIIHFYWGGQPLSLLRYMSVVSFNNLNKDWEIHVHMPSIINNELDRTWNTTEHQASSSYTGYDYTDKLKDVKNLKIIKHEFEDDWSDVHRSDYLRIKLLSTEGGFWSDFDIIYVLPMHTLYADNAESIHTILCHSDQMTHFGHSIGFLGSSGQSSLFAKLPEIKIDKTEYQSIGKYLLDNHIHQNMVNSPDVLNLSTTIVYPYGASHIRTILNTNQSLPSNTIGVHWYAGDEVMGQFSVNFTGSDPPTNTLTKIVNQHIMG